MLEKNIIASAVSAAAAVAAATAAAAAASAQPLSSSQSNHNHNLLKNVLTTQSNPTAIHSLKMFNSKASPPIETNFSNYYNMQPRRHHHHQQAPPLTFDGMFPSHHTINTNLLFNKDIGSLIEDNVTPSIHHHTNNHSHHRSLSLNSYPMSSLSSQAQAQAHHHVSSAGVEPTLKTFASLPSSHLAATLKHYSSSLSSLMQPHIGASIGAMPQQTPPPPPSTIHDGQVRVKSERLFEQVPSMLGGNITMKQKHQSKHSHHHSHHHSQLKNIPMVNVENVNFYGTLPTETSTSPPLPSTNDDSLSNYYHHHHHHSHHHSHHHHHNDNHLQQQQQQHHGMSNSASLKKQQRVNPSLIFQNHHHQQHKQILKDFYGVTKLNSNFYYRG